MRNALHPIMKALIGSELLGHSDEAVKVSVVLCLSEIMRITAPRQPYDDAVMKEIFQHIVGTFEKLSNVKSHCYSKAAQILDNVSKVRACVMLLDLECDTMVVDIIKLFLRIISSSHANDVFTNMEDIIIWIIKECDEVSGELLMPLVDSIKNENQAMMLLSNPFFNHSCFQFL
nr:DNA mismatch repair protein msh6 [Ipomoea batatas]